ncbi:3-ketoacyl-CoA synthase 11-like protein [Drosera capensis]
MQPDHSIIGETINPHTQIMLQTLIFCIVVTTVSLFLKFLSRRRSSKVFLVDYSCYKPEDTLKCSQEQFIDKMRRFFPSYTEEGLSNAKNKLTAVGLGSSTYLPRALLMEPPCPSLEEARKEAEDVMFGAIDEVLAKAGVQANQIRIVVTNCTLFNPTPSLSDMIVNRYKLNERVLSYDISGMGCSAGLYVIGLVKQLLKIHKNTYALVLSTENITENQYIGNDFSMMAANLIFRVGGAAILLSNRATDRRSSKYELIDTVHTNNARSNPAYTCIFTDEDSQGYRGTRITKDLLVEASAAIKANLSTLGLRILPISDKLLVAINSIVKRLNMAKGKSYVPNFMGTIDHFFPHVGGKPVLDALERTLKIKPANMEAARMTLYKFGNTSSSSIWYELAYSEAKGRVKKGDRLWQMAFGSGFKCSSVIWCAIRTIDIEKRNPWHDEIDEFPVTKYKCTAMDYFVEPSA